MNIDERVINFITNTYRENETFDDVLKTGYIMMHPIERMVESLYNAEEQMTTAYESKAYQVVDELHASGIFSADAMISYVEKHFVPIMPSSKEEEIEEARLFFNKAFVAFLSGIGIRSVVKVFLMKEIQPFLMSMNNAD